MAFDDGRGLDGSTGSAPLPFVAGGDGKVREVSAIVDAWRGYMPLDRLKHDPAPYRRLCSIGLDAGLQDQIPSVTLGATGLSAQLDRVGIAHAFSLFTGPHIDHTRERFETALALIPFFARVLATAERPGASGSR